MTDYPKFQPFWFYETDTQNHRITGRITEADDRYTHATTVGVSKYCQICTVL